MPSIRMNIILYAQTGCAITSGTIISDGINFELNTQNFLPPIVTDSRDCDLCILVKSELFEL